MLWWISKGWSGADGSIHFNMIAGEKTFPLSLFFFHKRIMSFRNFTCFFLYDVVGATAVVVVVAIFVLQLTFILSILCIFLFLVNRLQDMCSFFVACTTKKLPKGYLPSFRHVVLSCCCRCSPFLCCYLLLLLKANIHHRHQHQQHSN